MKTVHVLLTKYADRASSIVYYLTGRTYTHASLGVDGVYYSFNYKGFCTETFAFHKKRGVKKSALYELTISDAVYKNICDQIQWFQNHKKSLHYSRLGVLCCFLHIPFHQKNHYFCSQFVAEVLQQSGALQLRIPAGFYLPSYFIQDCKDCDSISKIQINPIEGSFI